MDERVCISVDKPSSLVDEKLIITVRGVKPHSLVTVVATLSDEAHFYSYARFRASKYGALDVSKTPSISGTYTGVEAMGLIWSMIQQPGQKPGRRLLKRDVTTPLVTTLAVFVGDHNGSEILDSEYRQKYCLASCTCERWYMAKSVERIPITDSQLHGTLFIPSGEGPFPGVLDCFGTAGGSVEHRAALLASRGTASLALRYYLPTAVEELEYYLSAVKYLLAHPKVSSSGAGVIGVSKGSEIAYLLAIFCPKIYACVNIGGADNLFGNDHSFRGNTIHKDQEVYDLTFKTAAELPPGSDINLANIVVQSYKLERQQSSLPVERAEQANFLILHGDDDQAVPTLCPNTVVARLRAHGKKNFTLVLYPGAGHLLEPPYAPHTYKSFDRFFRCNCIWGGKAKPHADAQEDSWRRILEFIKDHVPISAKSTHPHSNI